MSETEAVRRGQKIGALDDTIPKRIEAARLAAIPGLSKAFARRLHEKRLPASISTGIRHADTSRMGKTPDQRNAPPGCPESAFIRVKKHEQFHVFLTVGAYPSVQDSMTMDRPLRHQTNRDFFRDVCFVDHVRTARRDGLDATGVVGMPMPIIQITSHERVARFENVGFPPKKRCPQTLTIAAKGGKW